MKTLIIAIALGLTFTLATFFVSQNESIKGDVDCPDSGLCADVDITNHGWPLSYYSEVTIQTSNPESQSPVQDYSMANFILNWAIFSVIVYLGLSVVQKAKHANNRD